MWLLSSWWQSDKWDLLPPGPELFPVFTLPLSVECHLILVYFPNYTAWRIKGNFQGCSVVFKLGNVIMHVLWRNLCNNRHIYSIASSVVWKSDQISPHEVCYIMTSRKTINANFKHVQRIFKSSCLQKVNLETFSLYIWMFVPPKSRSGVWYNVAYYTFLKTTNIPLMSKRPLMETAETTEQIFYHLLWVFIPLSHMRFLVCFPVTIRSR